jgi:hypothetical protein
MNFRRFHAMARTRLGGQPESLAVRARFGCRHESLGLSKGEWTWN